MEKIDRAIAVILALAFVVMAVIVMLLIQKDQERRAQCLKVGGVYFSPQGGAMCFKRETLQVID